MIVRPGTWVQSYLTCQRVELEEFVAYKSLWLEPRVPTYQVIPTHILRKRALREQATKNPYGAFTCAALVFEIVYLSKSQWLVSKRFRHDGSISKTPWRLFYARSSLHSRPKDIHSRSGAWGDMKPSPQGSLKQQT